MNRTARGNEPA